MPLVIILLLFFIFLESAIVSIPLTLIFLLCLMTIEKKRYVLVLGFVGGLLLDVLLIRQVGVSALMFVFFLFLVMSYQKKFEIASYYFTVISAFFASLLYVLFFRIPYPFFQATAGAILAILFFALFTRVFGQKDKPHEVLK